MVAARAAFRRDAPPADVIAVVPERILAFCPWVFRRAWRLQPPAQWLGLKRSTRRKPLPPKEDFSSG